MCVVPKPRNIAVLSSFEEVKSEGYKNDVLVKGLHIINSVLDKWPMLCGKAGKMEKENVLVVFVKDYCALNWSLHLGMIAHVCCQKYSTFILTIKII